MTLLVSLEDAKRHLRVTGDDDDTSITLLAQAASAAVLGYIGIEQDFLDTFGEPDYETVDDPTGVPEDVQAATLILVGVLYKDRDGGNEAGWSDGDLPLVVRSLLRPYWTPAV